MCVGYCKDIASFMSCFRDILERKFLEYSFSWNDSFIGTKVLGTFEISLCGLFAPGNESAEERKGLDSLRIYSYIGQMRRLTKRALQKFAAQIY